MSSLTRTDVDQHIDLLSGSIGCAFRRPPRPVVAIFLHQQTDVLQSAVKFVPGVELPKFKLRRVDNLACVAMSGSALPANRSHKKISGGHEGEPHGIARGSDLRLDVGEAPRGIQRTNALPDGIAIERLSRLL